MQPANSPFYTSSCDSPISLCSADSGHSSLLMSLESSSCKPFRAFRSTDQYLIAMKEDLADWLNQLYSLDVNVENFISSLENGVLLCRHANNLMRKARSLSESGETVPKYFLLPPCASSGGRGTFKTSPSTSAISSNTWSAPVDKNYGKFNRHTSNTPVIVKRGETKDTTIVPTSATATVKAPQANKCSFSTASIAPSVNTSGMTRKSLLPRSTSSFNSHRSLSTSSSSSSSSSFMANCKASALHKNNSITGNDNLHNKNNNNNNNSCSKNSPSVINNNDINYNNYNKLNDESEFNSLTLRLASSSFHHSSSTSTSSSSLSSDQTIDTDDSTANNKSIASVLNTQAPLVNPVKSSEPSSVKVTAVECQTVQVSSSSNSLSSLSTRSPITKSISNQNFKTPPNSACNRFAIRNNDDSKSPNEINYWKSAKAQSFYARDNICSFLNFCRSIGIRECLLFECEDLVSAKNEKSVILCLLEVARKGAQLGMKIPLLIQMEQEIDKEIEQEEAAEREQDNSTIKDDTMSMNNISNDVNYDKNDNHHHTDRTDVNVNNDFDSQYNSETDSSDSSSMQQIVTNDLKSLHELVVDLLNRCTCPQQYPMIKVADGKYRIGDTKTLIFVRILRKVIMVRVGGGWDTLEHYLDKHDPCRCYYAYSARRKSTAPPLVAARNRY